MHRISKTFAHGNKTKYHYSFGFSSHFFYLLEINPLHKLEEALGEFLYIHP